MSSKASLYINDGKPTLHIDDTVTWIQARNTARDHGIKFSDGTIHFLIFDTRKDAQRLIDMMFLSSQIDISEEFFSPEAPIEKMNLTLTESQYSSLYSKDREAISQLSDNYESMWVDDGVTYYNVSADLVDRVAVSLAK